MGREPLNQQNSGFNVCVDQAAEGRIAGRVFGRRLGEPLSFFDWGQLLLLLNRLMDVQDFPQSAQRGRSFKRRDIPCPGMALLPEEAMDEAAVAAAKGCLGEFLLRVNTRRFSTWQGSVDFLDGAGPRPFSSDLELLMLLDVRFPF